MRLSRTLATALVAGSIPLFAGAATAAPLNQSMALKNAEVSAVEQVQFRRRGWRSGRWIGPAVGGFAAGVAIGALANPGYYGDGYYAYGAAPGVVVTEPGYVRSPRGYRDCPAGDAARSAYPSWMCDSRRETEW